MPMTRGLLEHSYSTCPPTETSEPWKKFIMKLLNSANDLVLQHLPVTSWGARSETVLQDRKWWILCSLDMYAQQVHIHFKSLHIRKQVTQWHYWGFRSPKMWCCHSDTVSVLIMMNAMKHHQIFRAWFPQRSIVLHWSWSHAYFTTN